MGRACTNKSATAIVDARRESSILEGTITGGNSGLIRL
jgi:hypothetical protein